MKDTICMKRKTLFKTERLDDLKDEPLKMYSNWNNYKENLEKIKKQLLKMLNEKTEILYINKNLKEMKLYLNIKKTLKKERIIHEAILDEIDDKQIKEHSKIYNETFELIKSIEKQVEDAFLRKVNRYKSFLTHSEFQQALSITASEAYEQLFNPEVTKDSVNRARYRFIQRATVKTSPLSYLGKTIYLSDETKITEQIKLNNVVKSLILMASLHNKDLDHLLQIKVCPKLKKCNGMDAVYFEKNYLLKGVDWILKQDDILHQKEVVDFLSKIQHCETPAEVKREVSNCEEITYEMLINNGLVIPNFNFYYSCNENFDDLLRRIFLDKEHHLFYPKSISDIKNDSVKKLLTGYLEKFNNLYLGETYQEKLNNVPLFYHDYVAFDHFNTPEIQSEFIRDIFKKCIVVNHYTYRLHQTIIMNKNIYEGQTVLSVLVDVHEKLKFQKNETPLPKIRFKPSVKKSAFLYLQSEKDGSLVLNNVNIGSGTVYHRYGDLFNENIKNKLKTYYENLFTYPYPIYELVIDEEISNHIDVGKSIFPKLVWPKDFLKVKMHISNDDIAFSLGGKPIQLIYVGTVPFHLFSGIKGDFLNLIHPWTVDINSIKNLDTRKVSQLNWQTISDSDDLSDTQFYYLITDYFKTNNLPFEFFVKKKMINFTSRKPIWISLYSVESIKVLKHLLLNERSIEIEEVKPRINGDYVEEFCILTTEGEC